MKFNRTLGPLKIMSATAMPLPKVTTTGSNVAQLQNCGSELDSHDMRSCQNRQENKISDHSRGGAGRPWSDSVSCRDERCVENGRLADARQYPSRARVDSTSPS